MWPADIAASLVATFDIHDPQMHALVVMYAITAYYLGAIGLPALAIGWLWGRRAQKD